MRRQIGPPRHSPGATTLERRQQKARSKAKRDWEAAETARLEREQTERERALRRRCHAFFDSLSKEKRSELEAEALDDGDKNLIKSYRQATIPRFAEPLLREVVFDYMLRKALVQ